MQANEIGRACVRRLLSRKSMAASSRNFQRLRAEAGLTKEEVAEQPRSGWTPVKKRRWAQMAAWGWLDDLSPYFHLRTTCPVGLPIVPESVPLAEASSRIAVSTSLTRRSINSCHSARLALRKATATFSTTDRAYSASASSSHISRKVSSASISLLIGNSKCGNRRIAVKTAFLFGPTLVISRSS